MSLYEAAEKYAEEHSTAADDDELEEQFLRNAFIAGANWQLERDLEAAVKEEQ